MKTIQCDNCGLQQAGFEMPVTLKGATGTSNRILVPEQYNEKHFCKTICFWEWVKKYTPLEIGK